MKKQLIAIALVLSLVSIIPLNSASAATRVRLKTTVTLSNSNVLANGSKTITKSYSPYYRKGGVMNLKFVLENLKNGIENEDAKYGTQNATIKIVVRNYYKHFGKALVYGEQTSTDCAYNVDSGPYTRGQIYTLQDVFGGVRKRSGNNLIIQITHVEDFITSMEYRLGVSMYNTKKGW